MCVWLLKLHRLRITFEGFKKKYQKDGKKYQTYFVPLCYVSMAMTNEVAECMCDDDG